MFDFVEAMIAAGILTTQISQLFPLYQMPKDRLVRLTRPMNIGALLIAGVYFIALMLGTIPMLTEVISGIFPYLRISLGLAAFYVMWSAKIYMEWTRDALKDRHIDISDYNPLQSSSDSTEAKSSQ
jgi:hypothetical protein